MRTAILTREWPPDIYGGAGVHVEHLVPELRKLIEVDVHCFGGPRSDATGHAVPGYLEQANAALQTLGVDLGMADAVAGCDVAHSHTWYANLGGHLSGLLHDIPHVITAHSLEPRRPWKREQLGGGYAISSWVEDTAYHNADAIIAVSAGMRADVLDCYPFVDPAKVHVVHNGIDTDVYRKVPETDALERYGIDPDRPFVLFVGRITRQKGINHLLRAALEFDESAPIVLCAASPDTPGVGPGGVRRDRRATAEAFRRLLAGRAPRAQRRAAVAEQRAGVRLPERLRAAGDREPGGDGVRGPGRSQ
ncbi:MAG: glycogen synthase [Candidatus Nanopelagicales bacterium]